MKPLQHLAAGLEALRAKDLLRARSAGDVRQHLRQQFGDQFIDASSNDYLSFGTRVSRETARALELPSGSGASRLIFGTHSAHIELERVLGGWVGQEDALLFSSGYAANVGLISSLAEPGDVVFSDRLNHASIIDGCRLSRAKVVVYRHLDLDDLVAKLAEPRQGRAWVISETYFSMDGDSPDLPGLAAVAREHRAELILDEAHALGVFGPKGAGLAASLGVVPAVLVGTLGKSVGTQGAFVAGPGHLIEWLWNRARSFVFSTAPSPVLVEVTRGQVQEVQRADEARRRLREACEIFGTVVDGLNLSTPTGRHGPIFPLLVGDNRRALALAEGLRERGVLAQAIRPPTVPEGSARVRLTLQASMSRQTVSDLGERLEQAWSALSF